MNKKSCTENSHFLITKSQTHYTDNNGYSGDRYSGNDGYSGLNPPDDAILFTVSGITAIADKIFGNFDKNDDFFRILLMLHGKIQQKDKLY